MAYRPPGLTQLLRRLRSDPPSAGWTRLSRRILVLPAGDEVVVGESNETGWTPVLSQVETFDAASIETAFVGEASVAVTVDRFTLGFAPTELVSPVGFASLRFAFHPSDATAANPQLTVNVGATRLSLVGDERIEATVVLSRSTGRSSTYHWP